MKNKVLKLLTISILSVLFAVCLFAGCTTGGTVKNVKVSFVNHNGSLLYATMIPEGSVPVYQGNEPTRPDSAYAQYTFIGWECDGEIYTQLPAIDKDTTFKATYSESKKQFVVTFVVNGQSVEKTFEYGETPSYDGETIIEIDGKQYQITGWDKPFTAVSENATYVATLTLVETPVANSYLVTFEVDSDSITETVIENERPKYYGVPYRKERVDCTFVFVGWSDGNDVYKPEELPVAVANVTYTAVFEAVYKTFTVKFNNEGNLVWETEVPYGQQVVYAGDKVEREADDKYFYYLNGWVRYDEVYEKELPAVYEDMTFEARFGKTLRSYSLTINYYLNGEITDSYFQNFTYGDDFQIKSPVISGYVASSPYLSGSITEDIVLAVEYKNYDVWDGTASTSFDGEGSEQSPYIIATAEDLAKLSADVAGGNDYADKHFKLNVDLDLANINWTAIGSNALPFAGIFDGNNHLIFNLSYNNTLSNTVANSGHGLFSTITGTVKNLAVSGSVTSIARYTALVVGHNNYGTVDNCTSYGDVYGFGNVGGVVGLCKGTVSNCVNYATVQDNGVAKSYRFGGVVGTTSAGVVENCINRGKVIINTSTTNGIVGGVIGLKEGNSNISNCYNYGYVKSPVNYAGGIVGQASGDGTFISNCYNYAPVEGATSVGGIVSYMKAKISISNCENYALIKGKGTVSGIVGYTNGDVSDCLNVGSIYATSTYSAGVVANTNASVINCVNYGDVYSKTSSVGGVIGQIIASNVNGEPNYVENCVNFGSVTLEVAGTNNVGGIVGKVGLTTIDGETFKPLIENCVNHGNINSAANYSGGVIGSLGGGTVRNCVNYGNVFAQLGTYVAGIAGSNWNYSLVTGCTNYGAILGGSTVGQICGQLTSTSTAPNNVSKGKLL